MFKPLKKYSDLSMVYFYITLSLYLILLVWIVIFKANVPYFPKRIAQTRAMTLAERFSIGSYPFKNIIECPPEASVLNRLKEHFLNVLVFLPFGILLPYIITVGTKIFVPLAFVTATIAVEGFQLFSGIGGFDVTDLLTNSLGGFIGLWMYNTVFSKMSPHIVNRVSFVINFIAAPIAVFAIYNTVIHFDYYI